MLSKLERRLYETWKTSRRRIAAKFDMHFIGSLIKLNRINEDLMHGHFLENFSKSWKISLVTNKNMEKVQAVPTREGFSDAVVRDSFAIERTIQPASS